MSPFLGQFVAANHILVYFKPFAPAILVSNDIIHQILPESSRKINLTDGIDNIPLIMIYRKLPNGQLTSEVSKYVKVWNALAQPFADLMGWKLHSCDPGMVFLKPNGSVTNVDMDIVRKIYADQKT